MLMPWLACTRRLMSRTVLELGRSSTQRFSSEKALTTCTTQSPLSDAMRPLMPVLHRHKPSDLDLGPKGLEPKWLRSTSHYITSHYITLHHIIYLTLPYLTLPYPTLPYPTLPYLVVVVVVVVVLMLCCMCFITVHRSAR